MSEASYAHALDHLYALGQELAPAPPLPDGTPAPRRKWDLAHMRTLCTALGDPQNTFPSVLIAGTNGKGSTASTLASILAAAGYKTALYTSPHLSRVNERIQILDGQRTTENGPLEIPDPDFARLYFQVDDTATRLVSSGELPHNPSFFEVLTALAFLYFAEEKVDIAVLEVGLGGRLDATNIVEPLLSIITDIALDHQEYLGNTITEIAREKAGILRPNGLLVTLPQHPEANQAIGEAAMALNVTGINAAAYLPPQLPSQNDAVLGSSSSNSSRSSSGNSSGTSSGSSSSNSSGTSSGSSSSNSSGTSSSNSSGTSSSNSSGNNGGSSSGLQPAGTNLPPERGFSPGEDSVTALPPNHYTVTLDNQPLEVDSPLSGHHQQRNIALAIATAEALRNLESYKSESSPTNNPLRNQISYKLEIPAIEAGIRNTRWPGRLEFLEPNLLLDVAHNPAGAWTLRAAIARLPESQPRTLLFSCLGDKDLTEMSRILFPLFDSSADRPGARGPRADDHIVLAPIANPRAANVEDLLAAAHALDIPAHAAPHLAGALAQARAITPSGGLIIATGSVYLVGAIRDLALNSGHAEDTGA